MVHGIREGKIVWSRPEIVVMITLGREKLMQHMFLGVHEATEQCVVAVLVEIIFLNCAFDFTSFCNW